MDLTLETDEMYSIEVVRSEAEGKYVRRVGIDSYFDGESNRKNR